MNQRTEYRCTRQALYRHPCIGQSNTSARQGHYITATAAPQAIDEMIRRYPDEAKFGFTVQMCKPQRGELLEWSIDQGLRYSDLKGMS